MADQNPKFDFISGEVLLFDKPLDWTSFDLVNKVRNLLCKRLGVKKLKVGHAGTLDPKATGLVVVCTGKQTKDIDSIQAETKEYIATLKLGATTPSFDLESEEDFTYQTSQITIETIQLAIKSLVGEIDQVPPVFSAIKINGKRAFHYARKGAEIEMPPRKVSIYSVEVECFEMPKLVLRISCSKGTYIRSLARDLGLALQSGAYLIGLVRTKIGDKLLENAFDLESFEKKINAIETN